MLNVDVKEPVKAVEQIYGLEAWFRAMGQTDFARMDEDKPLVHEVNRIIESEYRITSLGIFAVREDEAMRNAAKLPVVWMN